MTAAQLAKVVEHCELVLKGVRRTLHPGVRVPVSKGRAEATFGVDPIFLAAGACEVGLPESSTKMTATQLAKVLESAESVLKGVRRTLNPSERAAVRKGAKPATFELDPGFIGRVGCRVELPKFLAKACEPIG